MMKMNSTQIRSKSLYKKPSKDIYFPAVQFKNNINFPHSKKYDDSLVDKNLLSKDNSKPQVFKKIQISQFNMIDNNPQNSIALLLPRKNTEKVRPLFKSDKKMSRQVNHPKSNQKSNDWKNKSAVYFTKRQLGLFQKAFIQQQQRRKILDEKSLEKKDSFENFKKMKQMLRIEEKIDLLNDLQFKRLERQREKQVLENQKKLQQNFVHEGNLEKINMERYLKIQNKREQLSLSKIKLFQTEAHSEFLKVEQFKARKIHMNLLESRLQFLKNCKLNQSSKNGYMTQRITSRRFHQGGQNNNLE